MGVGGLISQANALRPQHVGSSQATFISGFCGFFLGGEETASWGGGCWCHYLCPLDFPGDPSISKAQLLGL